MVGSLMFMGFDEPFEEDRAPSPEGRSPYSRATKVLMLAVFSGAVKECFTGSAVAKKAAQRRLEAWVAESEGEYPFALGKVCEVLRIPQRGAETILLKIARGEELFPEQMEAIERLKKINKKPSYRAHTVSTPQEPRVDEYRKRRDHARAKKAAEKSGQS